MREEIASLVHPVMTYALALKERLDLGESPNMEKEQAVLKGLLGTDMEARRLIDYGGDTSLGSDQTIMGSIRSNEGRRSQDNFLGIRYALACWLDEIFVLDDRWGSDWNEYKIESALYGSNDRAWKFWEQARRAESRPSSDALEVYFLCVMLGFRGELRENPEKLASWINAVQNRLAKSQSKEWSGPGSREFPGDAAPRYGLEKFKRMMLVAGLAFLICVPIVAYILWGKVLGN